MKRPRTGKHIVMPTMAGVLLMGLLLASWEAVPAGRSQPGSLFVKPSGSGAECSQAKPCSLQMALSQAADGDTIYLAGGTYTGSGAAVVTVTEGLTLYGGWDGTSAWPPVRDPADHPTTVDGQDQRRGVYVGMGGALTLDGLVVTRGKSDYSGGGIGADLASCIIRNSQIVANAAPGDGGGIFINGGSAEIVNNQIISNTATWAGGLRIINDTNTTIVGNEIRGNVAAISGGGVEVDCCGGTAPLIARNWIANNHGGNRGGGVHVMSTGAELVNNMAAGNQATLGAGLLVEGTVSYPATVTMTHNTLVAGAMGGEGLRVDGTSTTTLVNNILTGYAVGITNAAPGSSQLAADHNLFWNLADPIAGTNAVQADPLLDDTYHLAAGSPARDAGADAGVTIDYDGDLRPVGGYDMGADEFVVPGAIAGIVSDGGGQPIAGVWVSAGDYGAILACGAGAYGAETEADGSYSMEVPPGSYLVYINSHWHPDGHVPEAYQDVNSWADIASATSVNVVAGATADDVDLSLPEGLAVTGRLVDSGGQPVTDAGGNLQDPDQGIEFGCALGFGSGDDGNFRVNVPAGTYDLSFARGGEGYHVRYGIAVTQDTDLGDVVFADAEGPQPIFDPQVLEAGYQVEPVVPGGPNTPSDVAVLPDGSVYLAAVRSWYVYKVGSGGTVTPAAPVGVYALDAASDGNLYGYFFPGVPGSVYRITPQGQVTTVGQVPGTACESTLAVAPNLDLWIGYNNCGGTSMTDATLYRMTQAGQLTTVAAGLPFGIGGLAFDAGGHLYMTLREELYRVDTTNGGRTLIATLPGNGSSHGLVVDPAGNLYVSSAGEGGDADQIFRVTSGGSISLLVELPAECVQGLAWQPGGDVLATARCSGALYRVHPDGTWGSVLPGNGMTTPQALAFSPTGELFVINDEAGRIVRIQNGRGEFFASVVSFISPLGHLAFEPSGDFYFSEAAPGFAPRLVRVSPGGQVTEVTHEVDWPSGLTFTPDGTLYVAEYESGEVSSVSEDGQLTVLANGLTRPQSMAADEAGDLYVASFEEPAGGSEYWGNNRLWRIGPDGKPELLARLGVGDLTFSPAGELYVTAPLHRQSGIMRVASDGTTTPFADGFLSAIGLEFDLTGDLYVSDDQHNSVMRITGFPQGTMRGRVTDAQTGQPIAGASLSVVTGYPVVLGTVLNSDADGRYSLPAAPRAYSVSASAPGYQRSSRSAVVEAGAEVRVDFALRPGQAVYLPVLLKGW